MPDLQRYPWNTGRFFSDSMMLICPLFLVSKKCTSRFTNGTIVNPALHSLHRGSLEIMMHTVPLRVKILLHVEK